MIYVRWIVIESSNDQRRNGTKYLGLLAPRRLLVLERTDNIAARGVKATWWTRSRGYSCTFTRFKPYYSDYLPGSPWHSYHQKYRWKAWPLRSLPTRQARERRRVCNFLAQIPSIYMYIYIYILLYMRSRLSSELFLFLFFLSFFLIFSFDYRAITHQLLDNKWISLIDTFCDKIQWNKGNRNNTRGKIIRK